MQARSLLAASFVATTACSTIEPRADDAVVTTYTDGGVEGTLSATTGSQGGSGIVSPADSTGGGVTGGTTGDVNDGTGSLGSDGAVFDLGGIPDVRRVECLQCEIELMTTQSNTLLPPVGAPLFVTAALDGQTVFGLGEADAGRIAVSGDGNVIYREGSCPLWPWLGDTGAAPPRVLCIGADWPCHGETGAEVPLEINHLHMYPGQLDYGGLTLPTEYEGDPAALHADYDLVVYFAVLDFATDGWDFDPSDVDTLESFAREQGGGLYFVAEYWGGGMGQVQLDSINAMVEPFGLGFAQQSLAWGPTGATVELECFPNPEG